MSTKAQRLPLRQKQPIGSGNVVKSGANKAGIHKFLVPADGAENVGAKPRVRAVTKTSVACGGDTPVSYANSAVNTDVQLDPDYYTRADDEQSTRDMLLSGEPDARYHALLSEQRRLALQAALRENLELAQELAGLREENRALKEVAEEGKRAAEMLREVLEGAESVEEQIEVNV